MVRKLSCFLGLVCSFAAVSYTQTLDASLADARTSATLVPTERQISLIEGKVISVHNGDTISVRSKERMIYTVWLQAIDAPEEKQEFGKRSRKNLEDLVHDKEVKVVVHKQDQYGRHVGTVYLRGRDVGLLQIEWGFAWHFKRFGYEQTGESRKLYSQAEAKARAERLGLWKDSDPVAPWEYRAEVEKKAGVRNDPIELRAVSQDLGSERPEAKPTVESADPPTPAVSDAGVAGKKYILGPRGGCYYVSDSGRKVYVKDKGLCADNKNSSKQP